MPVTSEGIIIKKTDKTFMPKSQKPLRDSDIATFARRSGPSGGTAGTDADNHTDNDTVAIDHDGSATTVAHTDTQADKD